MAISCSCDKCTRCWRNHSVSVTTANSSVAAAVTIITRSEIGLLYRLDYMCEGWPWG